LDDITLHIVHTMARMNNNILIIDDDVELCALLADFLRLEGFTTHAVHDGKDALSHCEKSDYSAIILDIMLPGMQGLEVLRRLREFSNTPVIMLTARGEDTDRIVGLELGADDYLAKPCNPRELSARLRAILRRVEATSAVPSTLTIGATHIDTKNRSATYNNCELNITSAEFNILKILLSHAGQVVDKDKLSEQALGRQLTAYDRSVDVHVSNLRRKLAALGGKSLIISVRGIGYQFAATDNTSGESVEK
jgi:DNA-binding response OmpR family regulator